MNQFRKEALDMYWDDGTDPGMYSGQVQSMGRTATTTYVGHAFRFVSTRTGKVDACYLKGGRGSEQISCRFFGQFILFQSFLQFILSR
jgi:hypothetical protein